MGEFLKFWWNCVREGWEVGEGSFTIVEAICFLISTGLFLFKKLRPEKWKIWEERVMKAAFFLFAGSFLVATVFVAPFLHYHESEMSLDAATNQVAVLTVTNQSLTRDRDELQRKQDKSESTLDAFALSQGMTNAPFNEKLDSFLKRFKEMETATKTTATNVQNSAETISQLQKELEVEKAQSAPNSLIYSTNIITHNTNGSITAQLRFHSTKNEALGVIQMGAQMPEGSTNKIITFWPDLGCGAIETGDHSQQILQNGAAAMLTYSLVGGNFVCVNLTISGPSQVQISGNLNLKTFIIDIK